jgi:hypothetical protein
MRRALKRLKILVALLVAVPLMGALGLGGWLTFRPPEFWPVFTAAAAKMICSNVFIAKRDADALVKSYAKSAEAERGVAKYVKIDVDSANKRVDAAVFGLFAKRYAAYAEGRGCTLVAKNETPKPFVVPPSSPAAPDVLWPAGEKTQSSDNTRLLAALNDPALQGPGMRAIVVVQDGRIVGETYGEGLAPRRRCSAGR